MELAPERPPCFPDQLEWQHYLMWCVRSHVNADDPKPIKMVAGVATLNPTFDFCVDCSAAHRTEMRLQERCRPDWLKTAAPVVAP